MKKIKERSLIASKNTLSVLGLSTGLLLSSLANAATFSSMTTVNQFSSNINSDGPPILGLSQFDPNLGTLNSVRITATGNFSIDFSLLAFVEDEMLAHSLAGELVYQGSISINDPNSNTGLLIANDARGVIFDCMGEAESFEACTDDSLEPLMDSGTYNGDSANDFEPLLTRLINNNLLSLFLGTGDIDGQVFEIGMFAFIGALQIFDNENITVEDIEGGFTLGPSNVTIEYDYTPTAVPVPAAAWLFGSSLALMSVLRRKNQ